MHDKITLFVGMPSLGAITDILFYGFINTQRTMLRMQFFYQKSFFNFNRLNDIRIHKQNLYMSIYLKSFPKSGTKSSQKLIDKHTSLIRLIFFLGSCWVRKTSRTSSFRRLTPFSTPFLALVLLFIKKNWISSNWAQIWTTVWT